MKSAHSNVALSAVLLLALLIEAMAPTIGSASAATAPITRVQSGLVAFDSLTTGNMDYWTFWGSAVNTPLLRDYYEDSQGLHIGVQSPYSGKWVNYAAVSPDTNAYLFHSVVTNPYSSISDGVVDVGLYVVASTSNYVGCIAVADFSGHYWAVVQAYGTTLGDATMTTLYQSPLNTMPLTQDCTIITNGDNYLKVYLGGNVVFSGSNMVMNMPTPFNAFLQIDASAPGSIHYGTYLNYYATSSERVTVTNAPLDGTVQVVDSFNNVLASVPVDPDGTATMFVGMYSSPLNAFIKVYDSTNTLVASTTSTIPIWGGDTYTIS
ncbi:MAG: hypothetical protein HYU39_06745 [Thaumarchaeota archaeon]|nr:hypothetical protein [Nitrososphaerota archaeon]